MTASGALSPTVEEYLEAIWRLGQQPKGVTTTGLAQRLGVRPASVTGMLRRLAEMKLVRYRRYRDISLTAEGERRACEIVRRHRLIERLLTDVLEVPLSEAHAEACRLEHAVSPELEDYIATKLGEPQACPHGNPIDSEQEGVTLRLSDVGDGETATIVSLEDESAEVVRYLEERGLLPGRQLRVKLREPLGGAIVVQVGREAQTLGPRLAASIRVQKAEGATSR